MTPGQIISAINSRKIALEWKVEVAGESGAFNGQQESPDNLDVWLEWRWEREWVKSGEPNATTIVDYSNGATHIALESGLDATPGSVTTVPTIVSDPSGVLDTDALPTSGWTMDNQTFTGLVESSSSAIYAELTGGSQSYGTPNDPLGNSNDWQGVGTGIVFTQLSDHAEGNYPVDLDSAFPDYTGASVGAPTLAAFAFKVIGAGGGYHQKMRFKFRIIKHKIPVVIGYKVRTVSYSWDFDSGGNTETGDSNGTEQTVSVNAGTSWETNWIEVTASGGQIKGIVDVVVKAVPWED